MQPARSEINEVLRGLAHETVCFCPNPGNAGDALIAHATYELLRRQSIEYEIVPHAQATEERVRGKVILYGGGGSFTELFPAAARVVEVVAASARRLIVLPQTISGHETLLASLGEHVTLLCRERVSFAHARRHAKAADVHLVEDVVFGVDVTRLLASPAASSWPLPRRRKWLWNVLELRWREWRKRLLDRRRGTEGILNCFRGGRDRPDVPVPEDNIDVSALLAGAVHPEEDARRTSYRFVRFLSRFHTIRTNRLHVAIGGALLGKRVAMYANSTYKNRAVYEFSLEGRFPNVTWLGDSVPAS